jgi:hypothetical protein
MKNLIRYIQIIPINFKANINKRVYRGLTLNQAKYIVKHYLGGISVDKNLNCTLVLNNTNPANQVLRTFITTGTIIDGEEYYQVQYSIERDAIKLDLTENFKHKTLEMLDSNPINIAIPLLYCRNQPLQYLVIHIHQHKVMNCRAVDLRIMSMLNLPKGAIIYKLYSRTDIIK